MRNPKAKGTGRNAHSRVPATRSELDLSRLEARARRSEAREAVRSFSSRDNYSLSVVAAAAMDGSTSFSVELAFRVMENSAEGEIPALESALRVSRRLEAHGYAIVHQGDGIITWEKPVPRDEVVAECERLTRILRSSGRRGVPSANRIPRARLPSGVRR